MQLETWRTGLRPVDQHDLGYIYSLLTDARVGTRVRLRGTTPSFEEFRSLFYDGALLHQIAEEKKTGRPIGLISAHSANLLDGHAHFSVVAEPEYHRTGLMVEALAGFLRHLFLTWPFRKVYGEAIETSLPQYASALRTIVHSEGILRQHTFAEGEFRDVNVLAIYRDEFLHYLETRLRGLEVAQ